MWRNRNTGGEFVLHSDIRYELWKSNQEAPGVLTDEYLASVGYDPVVRVQPEYDRITQGVTLLPAIEVNGEWVQQYTLYNLDPTIVLNNQNLIDAQAKAKWQIISPRQIRQALTAAGLRSAVEDAVAGGSQDLKDWWEFATQFERQHPMVVAMAASLGVSETSLDEVFQAGSQL